MKREIKFRAFDKGTNKMIATGYHVIGEITMFDMIEQYLFENRHGKTTLDRMGDVVEMQYTGLKDKNGVEIYEGDIVKTITKDFEFRSKGKIEFINGQFAINVGPSYIGDDEEDRDNYTYFWCLKSIEVIGNIYEHPQLLNSEQSPEECDASKGDSSTTA